MQNYELVVTQSSGTERTYSFPTFGEAINLAIYIAQHGAATKIELYRASRVREFSYTVPPTANQ